MRRRFGNKSRIVLGVILLLIVVSLYPINVTCDSSQLKRGCPEQLITNARPDQVCFLVVKKPFIAYVLRVSWHYSLEPKCKLVQPTF
jgi:hypothetical protein